MTVEIEIHMKRVTINCDVFQEVPKDEEPRPTIISLDVNPLLEWPDSMRVALLHLAGLNAMFSDYNTFTEFKQQMEERKPIDHLVSDWTLQLNGKRDPWAVLKYLTASPKPVEDEPPHSACPRCGEPLWWGPVKDKAVLAERYKTNPAPPYCLKCGQRFKYDGGRLAYAAVANEKAWARRLSREAEAEQPTLVGA
jgi:hypothetical protein